MELQPWIGSAPRREPPTLDGLHLFEHKRLNIVLASLVGLPPAVVWGIGYFLLIDRPDLDGGLSVSFGLLEILGFLLAFVATIVVHEGLHGLAVAAQGHRPIFGAGPGFFYTSVYEPLSRNGYFAVIVTPAIVINGGSVLLGLLIPDLAGWSLLVSTINTTGLGGDAMMAWQMRRYPANARIVDLADGYAVYLPAHIANGASSNDR